MAKKNWNKLFEFVAFVGLILIAVVLILQKVFSSNGALTNAMQIIGQSIAYFITAVSAYFYVRSKRNIWWFIAYAVAAVLVVVFMIIMAL